MDTVMKINGFINDIVWGIPGIILLVGTGIFFTIRLKFVQITKFGYLFKNTIIKAFKQKDEKKVAPGELTSFQAAMESVAAIVGTGNIAGVATAIVAGGPGALFWMLVAAFFGMATKFAEIVLGLKYRKINEDGSVSGGGMFYLRDGLKRFKWLGTVFAILVLPFSFVMAPVGDTNTIVLAIESEFSIPTIISGIILAVIVAFIVLGGNKRVGYVCSLIAPFMGIAYMLAGLCIIFLHIGEVPSAIAHIFSCAFSPRAATGGVIGSFFICLRFGVARGINSNEAGLGTAAMLHCGAKVDKPVEQALWGPIEVFLDTFVICTITGLAIVLSGLWNSGMDGAVLTMNAFGTLLPGNIGRYICLFAVVLFGFTCEISYYTYAVRAADFLFGRKSERIVKLIWPIMIFVGSQTTLGFAWDLVDTVNGLMIIPNLIGILLLSNQVVKEEKQYFGKYLQ